jgi:hypothetical protein
VLRSFFTRGRLAGPERGGERPVSEAECGLRHRLRPAELEQRAGAAAFRTPDRRWGSSFCDQGAEREGSVLGQPAQAGVERHHHAASGFPVEQRALGHRPRGHFLQAQRLGAKLHLIGAVLLRLAALEFDGVGGLAAVATAELHQVGDAHEIEPSTGERQCGDAAYAALFARSSLVRPLMQHVPLGGETVLGPHAFEVNERCLAQAINGVLERGDGDRVGEFLRHVRLLRRLFVSSAAHSHSMISTPSRRPSPSISMM